MKKVVGVVFLNAHKKYYFEALPELKIKDYVVVETVRGLEIGRIVEEEKEIDDSEVVGELKPVIRIATENDFKSLELNDQLKESLKEEVKGVVRDSKLDMKVLECEYTLDRSKLIIYFTADQRVDFRELVKVLASMYKTRIELRQIGPRDASRIVGGIGPCGRELCCSTFLGDIQNVTIKMAKNQDLTLNPTTISGLCGKLLCCISFEDEVYTKIREELPDVGSKITINEKEATVDSINIIDESINITFENGDKDVVSLSTLKGE